MGTQGSTVQWQQAISYHDYFNSLRHPAAAWHTEPQTTPRVQTSGKVKQCLQEL